MLAVDDEVEDSFLKNKLPEGRSAVSSLREKAPSFVGCLEVSPEDVSSVPGGEWSFMNESPYCSF